MIYKMQPWKTTISSKTISHSSRWMVHLLMAHSLVEHLHQLVPAWVLVLETLLWMEPPTCGSLMSTYVAMIVKSLLPPYLLNLLPSLMWRRPFMSYPLSSYHSLPALENDVVVRAKKTTWFYTPWFLLIINVLVIKMNFRILRLFIPFLIVSCVILAMRAFLSSSSTIYTVMGVLRCVPIILFIRWLWQFLGSFCYIRALSFSVSHLGKESHTISWNGYLKASNRNSIMWKGNWRTINIVYLICRFWNRWW